MNSEDIKWLLFYSLHLSTSFPHSELHQVLIEGVAVHNKPNYIHSSLFQAFLSQLTQLGTMWSLFFYLHFTILSLNTFCPISSLPLRIPNSSTRYKLIPIYFPSLPYSFFQHMLYPISSHPSRSPINSTRYKVLPIFYLFTISTLFQESHYPH